MPATYVNRAASRAHGEWRNSSNLPIARRVRVSGFPGIPLRPVRFSHAKRRAHVQRVLDVSQGRRPHLAQEVAAKQAHADAVDAANRPFERLGAGSPLNAAARQPATAAGRPACARGTCRPGSRLCPAGIPAARPRPRRSRGSRSGRRHARCETSRIPPRPGAGNTRPRPSCGRHRSGQSCANLQRCLRRGAVTVVFRSRGNERSAWSSSLVRWETS